MQTSRQLFFSLAAFLFLGLIAPSLALAAPAVYGVVPFPVEGPSSYKYLENGIPEMLSTRLYWKDRTQPADKSVLAGRANPASREAADAIMSETGLNYLVWGTLTITGQDAVLSVSAQERGGQTWSKQSRTKVDALVPAMEKIVAEMNVEVLKRPEEVGRARVAGTGGQTSTPTRSAGPAGAPPISNPEIIYNETDDRSEYYLNPAFRYAGGADGGAVLRSPRLKITGVGMAVGDADGDGLNEVFIISENTIYALKYRGDSQLEELANYRFAQTNQALHIDMMDLNRDGLEDIIISVIDSENVPKSMILNFDGSKFDVVDKDIPFFMAVQKVPPDYVPRLLLQKKGNYKLFEPGVYMADKVGGKYVFGGRLLLPEEANVFNVTYLPDQGSYKVVITGDRENLKVYTDTGDLMSKTEETYSGSPIAMTYYNIPPGMGVPKKAMESSMYYVPIRKIPADLTGSGQYDLLVTRPISVAAQFFERYRYFPQGEIHSLFWDNIGLNLRWKTRRIKGAVVDFALADVTNNGQLDLAVCVNTYPGALGVESRRTVLMVYPLDPSQIDIKPDYMEE